MPCALQLVSVPVCSSASVSSAPPSPTQNAEYVGWPAVAQFAVGTTQLPDTVLNVVDPPLAPET